MPLTKAQKGEALDVVRKLADESKLVVLSDYKGISVEAMTQLRKTVRDAKGHMKVVKNTLSRRVFDGSGHGGFRDLLVGQTALAFANEDPVGLAKQLTDFAKTNEKFVIKGGLFGTSVLNKAQVTEMASVPPREVQLAMLMGWMNSSTASLMGALDANVRSIMYLLKGMEEKAAKPASEDAVAPSDAAAPAA